MPGTRTGRTWWVALGIAVVVGGGLGPATAQENPVAVTGPAGPTPEGLAGAYDGTAVGPDGALLSVHVELQFADGQFTGAVDAEIAQVNIVGGTLAGDTLTLTVDAGGTTGVATGRVSGDRIEGTWALAGMTGSFLVARPGAAAADPISGAWTGEVYVQGQAMPFSLTLRVTGEAVAGEIESAMGTVPLVGGTWKDGTLTILFPYVGGEPVSMGAQLKNGRLEGIVDYNTGELQGTWVASRK